MISKKWLRDSSFHRIVNIVECWLNYTSESTSSGSLNPFNHNSLSYPLCLIISKTPSITKKMAIGVSGGLIEYKINGNEILGVFSNQNLGVTMLKVINGVTAPIMGDFYGTLRQGVGGYGINKFESNLKK